MQIAMICFSTESFMGINTSCSNFASLSSFGQLLCATAEDEGVDVKQALARSAAPLSICVVF